MIKVHSLVTTETAMMKELSPRCIKCKKLDTEKYIQLQSVDKKNYGNVCISICKDAHQTLGLGNSTFALSGIFEFLTN